MAVLIVASGRGIGGGGAMNADGTRNADDGFDSRIDAVPFDGAVVAGHTLVDGTRMEFPHRCPGEGCAIFAWLSRNPSAAQQLRNHEAVKLRRQESTAVEPATIRTHNNPATYTKGRGFKIQRRETAPGTRPHLRSHRRF